MANLGAPWHYESDGGEYYVVDKTKLQRICTMQPRSLDVSIEDMEARCRTAAQAPRLKQTVKELLELIEWIGPPQGYTYDQLQNFMAIKGAKKVLEATETNRSIRRRK